MFSENEKISSNTVSLQNEESSFCKDVLDLFSFERYGHIGSWQYSDQLSMSDPVSGAVLWERFINNQQNYYPATNDKLIIHENINKIKPLIKDIEIVVEYGPGNHDVFLDKTAPIIRRLSSQLTYIPIDVCEDFLEQLRKNFIQVFPHGNYLPYAINFFQEYFLRPLKGKSLYLFLGGTMGNIEGHPRNGMPLDKVIERLRHLRNNMKDDDLFLITQDCNQDEESVIKAYQHPDHKAFGANVMYRIERDLEVKGHYKPEAWRYETLWEPDAHMISHTVVCDEDQYFHISGYHFKIQKGARLYLNNSIKFPKETFVHIAQSAGFEPIDVFMDHQDRMALHVLRAV